MDIIERLVAEHRLVSRALSAFEEFVQEVNLTRGTMSEREDMVEFVTFFQEFLDISHHAKEEALLGATRENGGFAGTDKSFHRLLTHHESGRKQLDRLRAMLNRSEDWDNHHAAAIVREALAYGAFVRNHVREEEEVLFPMIRAHLAPDVLARLSATHEHGITDGPNDQVDAQSRRMAEQLVNRYQPSAGERETAERLVAHRHHEEFLEEMELN